MKPHQFVCSCFQAYMYSTNLAVLPISQMLCYYDVTTLSIRNLNRNPSQAKEALRQYTEHCNWLWDLCTVQPRKAACEYQEVQKFVYELPSFNR